MFRILFLLLVVMGSFVFAQTEDKPQAVQFDEFETATNGYVKMKMDAFYIELGNNPNSQGYIFNYGTDNEIALREKQIRVSIQWRKFDGERITMVRVGFWKNIKTEFWVIPPGAEKPLPTSNGKKIDEFGKIPSEELQGRIDNLYNELNKNLNSQGYILNYGLKNEIIIRERQIKRFIKFGKLDLSRVTIKNVGFNNNWKTEFWIIPSDDDGKKPKTK